MYMGFFSVIFISSDYSNIPLKITSACLHSLDQPILHGYLSSVGSFQIQIRDEGATGVLNIQFVIPCFVLAYCDFWTFMAKFSKRTFGGKRLR